MTQNMEELQEPQRLTIQWRKHAKLTAEELLKRMEFPERNERIVAAVRKSKD